MPAGRGCATAPLPPMRASTPANQSPNPRKTCPALCVYAGAEPRYWPNAAAFLAKGHAARNHCLASGNSHLRRLTHADRPSSQTIVQPTQSVHAGPVCDSRHRCTYLSLRAYANLVNRCIHSLGWPQAPPASQLASLPLVLSLLLAFSPFLACPCPCFAFPRLPLPFLQSPISAHLRQITSHRRARARTVFSHFSRHDFPARRADAGCR